jgi:thioredoxin reductase (NADPH)
LGEQALNNESTDLLIIGAGPCGLTAALYGHRSGLKVLVVGGETPGGQVMVHHNVENFPGFPGGVSGVELMARWIKQVTDETGEFPLVESVVRVDFSSAEKRVFTSAHTFSARVVILATGSRPRRLNVPGESEYSGKGVFYCATCDAPMLRTMERRRAVVVGGGDTAMHTALALLPHAETVSVITRGPALRAKPVLINRFLEDSKARVVLNRSVKAVTGDQVATAVTLENTLTKEQENMLVEAVFVGIGQTPVTEFLNGAVELDQDGFIVTDNLLRTSVAGVFAAGDVRTTPLRQIITAASDGALAAHSAAEYLRMSSR